MSCVHVVEVEWVQALSYLRGSLGEMEASRILVCWVCMGDQEQRYISVGPDFFFNFWFGEGGRVMTIEKSVGFYTCDFFVEAREAVTVSMTMTRSYLMYVWSLAR